MFTILAMFSPAWPPAFYQAVKDIDFTFGHYCSAVAGYLIFAFIQFHNSCRFYVNTCRNLKYLQVFKVYILPIFSVLSSALLPGLLLALLHRGVALGSFLLVGTFDSDAELFPLALPSLSCNKSCIGHYNVVLGLLHHTIRNRLYSRGRKRCILRNVVYSLCFLMYASLTNSYSFSCLLLNGLNDLFNQRQM